MFDWRFIDNWVLSKRAQEYFGGDVQRFSITKRGPCHFEIQQTPHWGDVRVVAVSNVSTQREAIKEFNDMARHDDRQYA